MKYQDITFNMLGTKRQRPMYVSAFTKFRGSLSMKDYPKDAHAYTPYFLQVIDQWVKSHKHVQYLGLDQFTCHNAILGTTHQLDELHYLYGNRIVTLPGEYKYHRRLTDFTVRTVSCPGDLAANDVFVVSYPSCITTGVVENFDEWLQRCLELNIPVHIDGAWFGQCRNFVFDVSHPAVKSVSVSLSKALGMGSQRIGIRYTREKTTGPISIMNDFRYCNVSDMWLGANMIDHFGPDFWWNAYSAEYAKVCKDFDLIEANSFHVAFRADHTGQKHQMGIRTPLRFLIDGFFDQHGTDQGLNSTEQAERT